MKIVYFNYLYDLYGSSIGSTRKAELLMSELAKLGNDVKIFWMKKQAQTSNSLKTTTHNFLKKRFAKFVHDPKLFLLNIKYIIKEYQILKREKPDLIISRLDLYLFSSLFLAKLMKIPIIIEADCPAVYEARQFQKEYWNIPYLVEYIEKMNLQKSDISICVSNSAKDYFVDKGVSESKIRVIANGADIDRFHPLVDSCKVLNKYKSDGKIIVGFVGSFHFWHGVENLIEVIKKILESNENTVFLMVGDGGPMKSTIEDFVNKENFQKRVIMTGYINYEEMPEYISAMNIVLAPYPGLDFFYYSPVKIFEYMACGKPVVTTRIGQIAEIIENGENGVLCEPDNIQEICLNLLELIKNKELRSSIGKNARETISSNYTWRKKALEFSNICKQLVNTSNVN